MPQLNPSPWLAIMMLSWLTFLIIVPPKIMTHLYPNGFVSRSSEELKMSTWNWPWV
uniref:ATP synthase complex subunit 8 n=1 Tax=Johnius carouna TaxID=1642187 RepID=A0A343K068_9TELE|nr:ATP synthase F0 subunit 8 [Johnius carouna]ATA66316.1 ATP synthase F0 subunit 8 [Johnius carouna]